LAILKLTDVTVGLRVTEEHEEAGLDASQHGEVAYRV
jgi:ammonia channel protein AmtB